MQNKPVKQKKPEKQADIYAVRKQKKRRKILRRSAWFIAGAIFLIVIYQKRDVWLPKLENISGRSGVHNISEEQDQADFPITVYSGTQYQAAPLGGYLSILSDSYLHVYEHGGSTKNIRQQTYGNAILRTEGEFGLVYESGGTRFRLETAEKAVYEKSVSDQIIYGTVSAKGYAALITMSDTCACKLFIFNEKGHQIHQRDCVEQLSCLCFLPDSTGCYAVSIGTEAGSMQSYVHKYSFSEKSAIWKSKPLDTFAISVYNTNDGGVCLIGDRRAAYLTAGGGILHEYMYPDTFEQGCFAGDTAVILTSNKEQRTRTLTVFPLETGQPVTKSYGKEIRSVGIYPERREVLVQMRSKVLELDYSCEMKNSIPVMDGCDRFLRIGADLYLLGYNTVDRVSLS